jgi:hypothetical protein
LHRIDKRLASKRTHAELGEELRYWLSDVSSPRHGIDRALENLCWSWKLTELAKRLPASLWWTLLNRLVENCHNAAKLSPDENPVVQQILAGELPLTLAYLFPELKSCRKLAGPARKTLAAGLEKLIDDAGFLQGRYSGQLGQLLATWTRSRKLGARLRRGSWGHSAQTRYREAVIQALRASRGDGSVALTPAGEETWTDRFWQAALEGAESRTARRLARRVLPKKVLLESQLPADPSGELPDSAAQSDPSKIAMMRSSWRRRSDLLAVEYSGSTIKTELVTGRAPLWTGAWTLDVQVNGAPLVPLTPWESVCWVSDEDIVYFELEMGFANGIRAQRQMLLARNDRIALMIDTVLGKEPAEILYRSTLPLGPSVEFEAVADTRELELRSPATRARVLPCALGEWRSSPSGGSLEVVNGSLVSERSMRGTNLLAPLFFDIDPRRSQKPLTWRPLTVAENREILPADVAAGYRVQIGRQQWLVYRATAERSGRTVLGANTWSQFLLMRIKPSGKLETLLEIE